MANSIPEIFPGREFSIKVTGVEENPEYVDSFVNVAGLALNFITDYNDAHNSLADRLRQFRGRPYQLDLTETDPATHVKSSKKVTANMRDMGMAMIAMYEGEPAPLWAMAEFELLPFALSHTAIKIVNAYFSIK